jgi:UDP-glucose 4-epimerase
LSIVLVTGGAGFIGSHLVDYLSARGDTVRIVDNFSTGREENVILDSVELHRLDLLQDSGRLSEVLEGVDTVYHLAANADVRDGWGAPRRDLEQNVIATLNLAEASAHAGVKEFIFTSTGSVYGESAAASLENAPMPLQTSLYGASKISAEAFLEAYATAEKFRVTIFRLVSALGPRYSHGHVIDFVRRLKEQPEHLDVLGNGKQVKSYMHVSDCVRGISSLRGEEWCEVFNLGRPDVATVRDSIGWITEELGLSPGLRFGTENRGWIGDNPFILLDVSKAKKHGWEAHYSIRDSVVDTVRWLMAQDESEFV